MKPVSVSFEIGPKSTSTRYRIKVHWDLLLIYRFCMVLLCPVAEGSMKSAFVRLVF